MCELTVVSLRRFGFPNRAALAEGRSGTDCRGEEHEVVIIWSVTSGKRQILMDGKEIHYSATRTGVIDHSWSSKGNHVMKVVCHAAPPMSANPGFRQYDLFIDGQSFFNMPKVYELGVRGSADRMPGRNDYEYSSPRSVASPGSAIHVPRNRDEENEELQRAINASLEESRKHLQQKGAEDHFSSPAPAPGRMAEADLFDMGAPAPPPSAPAIMPSDTQSVTSYMSAPTQVGYHPASAPAPYASPPPQQPYPGAPPPPPGYGAPPPTSLPALPSSQPPQPVYGANPASPPAPQAAASNFYAAPPPVATSPHGSSFAGDFGPAMHGSDDPFAPKPPTHNDIASDILKNYSASPPSTMGTPSFDTQPPPSTPGAATYEEAANLTMNGLALTQEPEENLTDIEKAMRKLVNVDHIDEPAEEQVKLTMKKEEEILSQKNKGKSKPLPPAAHKMVGSGATLGQISEVKAKAAPKEGIMNVPPQPWHPEAAAAGMLVVHGLQNSGAGPPPLQPRGFGVVHGQPYAYAAAQQQYASPQGYSQYR